MIRAKKNNERNQGTNPRSSTKKEDQKQPQTRHVIVKLPKKQKLSKKLEGNLGKKRHTTYRKKIKVQVKVDFLSKTRLATINGVTFKVLDGRGETVN